MYQPQNYYSPYFQQQQQIFNAPSLSGKMVNDFSEIMASDVPMDGRVALFPKNDYSEIHLKTWGRDGRINTIMYRPVQSEMFGNTEQQENREDATAIFNELGAKIDEVLSRLDRLEGAKKPTKAKDGDKA